MDAETAVGSLLAAGGRLASLIEQVPNLAPDGALRLLAQRLDEVALAYHDIPDCPPDDREAQAAEKKFDFSAGAAAAFPALGQYWCADPSSEAPLRTD